MSEADIEKWPAKERQQSTSLSSSGSALSSHHTVADEGPAQFLTPTISHASANPVSRNLTNVTTSGTTDPNFEVDWEGEDDPRNPRNWSTMYKGLVIFAISFGTVSVVAYSTSYTSGIPAMQAEFNIKSEPIATLGVTTYLIGLAIGSLILAPISETYGRKPAYVVSMAIFTILFIPCALATSMAEIIVVRFFAACTGAVMIANSPGTVADITNDEYRAMVFSIWGIGPMNGPVIGPIIGGFVTEYLGWRWTNWIVMMMAGVSFFLVLLIQETYTPAILSQRAAKARKETDDPRWWSRYDQRVGFLELMKINLSRPFIMAVKEQICIFWNVYIAIIYGILYLCFVAYPIVFAQRGFTVAQSGLAFIGIGIGVMIAICSEPLIRKLINAHAKDPETGTVPPEAAMAAVCIGSVCIPVGELWFAWTGLPKTIHWAAPIAAGIPFGAGNTVVFIYATNYLAHSYGIYAASAMAGNSVVRSFLGGTLPLAGPAMYKALGANWAGTLLGLLEIAIIPIPFVFYRYGAKIRKKSTLIRRMQEDKARAAKKRERGLEKQRAQEKATGSPKGTETDPKGGEADTKETEVEFKTDSQDLSPLSEIEMQGEKQMDGLIGMRTHDDSTTPYMAGSTAD